MALTLLRYGRYSASQEVDFGVMVAGQIRACIFNVAGSHIWVKALRALLGKQSPAGTTQVRLALYQVDEGTNKPGALIYASGQITVTAVKDDATGGTEVIATLGTPIKLIAGFRYALAIHCTNGAITHSMRQASGLPPGTTNSMFYDRAGIGTTAPNPYGTTTGTNQGHLTIWVEGNNNEAPTPPVSRSPSGAENSVTPLFTATFRDRNGTWGPGNDGEDTGDIIQAYRVQLRQQGSGTLKWNQVYTANGTEQAADQMQRPYGGSSLSRGTTYEWRVQFQDQFGAWGSYGSADGWIDFTPNNLGFITMVSPTGKITDDTPDFQARWTHQTSLAMNAVQIRVYGQNNNLLQESGVITVSPNVSSSASPGTLFTIPWANAAAQGLTALQWGTNYKLAMRGRDTGGGWSDWQSVANLLPFKTNSAPGIPTNVTPANGSIFTTGNFPRITANASDADGDSLTVEAVITRPNASTVTVTLALSMVTGKYEFQTTGTQLNAFGTYQVRVRAYDGHFYSGETTSSGSAAYSTTQTFQYLSGPSITITDPDDLDTITTSSFDVDWTVTTQTRYKVDIFDPVTLQSYYSSGWIVSSGARTHTVPAGWVVNGTSPDLRVTVEDNVPLEGSDTISISISFTPPASLTGFQVNPKQVNSPWLNSAEILFDQSLDPDFAFYLVRREAASGPDKDRILWWATSDSSLTIAVDHELASGIEYTYYASQVIDQGGTLLESDPVSGSVTIELGGVVLSAVGEAGDTYNVSLRYTADRDVDRERDEALFIPLDGSAPQSTRSRGKRGEFNFDAQIISDRWSDFLTKASDLEALDDSDLTICYRDNYRRKEYVKFKGTSGGLRFKDKLVDRMTATIGLRSEAHKQGVTLDG